MADVIVQLGGKTQAWVNANPNHLLEERQHLYILDGVNAGRYYIGNGTTPLIGLPLYGGSGSYTFENGLTESGGVVRWDGNLTQNTTINGGNIRNLLLGDSVGNNNLRRFTVNALVSATINSPTLKLSQQTANSILTLDASNDIQGVTLGALQSIRRNAANNAFEAYTPSSGGGNGFNSITYSGQYKINGFFAIKSASSNWVGVIYLQPYVIGLDHTITELGLEVTTNTAGATVRLAVYQDNNGEPGELLDESGAIPAATAGFVGYTFASPIALTTSMKVIWLAFQVSTSALGLRVGGSWNVIGKQTTGQTSDQRSRAFTYGAYPNPIGANSNTNFNIPCMWVRVQ